MVCFAALFLLVSALCSIPRFGQRENEGAPGVSDSDLYIEMAEVFTGSRQAFTAEYVTWQPHHYNRPLLSFLAGHIAKWVLHGNLRAAFSLINILSAATIAVLLMHVIQTTRPEWNLAWLPSMLFLTGFPQLNWGYHIFTDTLGYATAFVTASYGAWLVRQSGKVPPRSAGFWIAHLLMLAGCSSIAFLARETAWLAVIVVAWVCWERRPFDQAQLLRAALILAALLIGKLPHSLYSHAYHLRGVPMKSSFGEIFNWRYVVDFTVKSAVCFNLSWLPAAWAFWRRQGRTTPTFVIGWAIGASLYIGAGYFVNKIQMIGYPLRMTFALFPLVFFWATDFFESSISTTKRMIVATAFCILQIAINRVGVMLDPGTSGIKATEVFNSIRHWLGL